MHHQLMMMSANVAWCVLLVGSNHEFEAAVDIAATCPTYIEVARLTAGHVSCTVAMLGGLLMLLFSWPQSQQGLVSPHLKLGSIHCARAAAHKSAMSAGSFCSPLPCVLPSSVTWPTYFSSSWSRIWSQIWRWGSFSSSSSSRCDAVLCEVATRALHH